MQHEKINKENKTKQNQQEKSITTRQKNNIIKNKK